MSYMALDVESAFVKYVAGAGDNEYVVAFEGDVGGAPFEHCAKVDGFGHEGEVGTFAIEHRA